MTRALGWVASALWVSGAWAQPTRSGQDSAPEPAFQTVVTGTRTEQRQADSTVATEIITRRQIQDSGARDLAELLETQAGVQIERTPRGAAVRLQGLDAEYVLVLIDGERAAGRMGGQLDLSRFSLTEVERVEIVKGPASVLYGSDAMGGVINLITRTPGKPFELSGRGAYGTQHQVDARGIAGVVKPGVRVQVQGGYRTLDAYDLNPADVATTGAALGQWDVGGGLTLEPTDDLKVTARTEYTRKEQQGIDALGTGAVIDRRGRSEAFDAAVTVSYAHTEQGRVLLRAHHAQFRDQLQQDQRAGRELDQYADSRERLYEVGLQVDQPFGTHLATAGVEALFENLLSPRLNLGSARRYRIGALLQDDWKLLAEPCLSLTGGVRVDVDSMFGASVSPRLAARWDPVPKVTLRGSYGWGFRAPSFTEQYLLFQNPSVGYIVQGNPALRPERSQGVNLSVDTSPRDWLRLSASAFFTDVRDLIATVTTQEVTAESLTQFSYANIASARMLGGEVGVQTRIVTGLWLDLGYALTATRNARTGEVLEGRALHRGTAQLSWKLRPVGFEVTVRSALVGRRPFRPDVDGDGVLDFVWARPYVDLDVKLSQRLSQWANVYGIAQNLLNAGDALYLPLPPRSFQVGLEVKY
ncbi:MAG: TonB-dependent receptor plug domain-containing protein [Myxococcaceae bacterium]